MSNKYKLGIGPMSKQIIKSVYSYSETKNIPLMLIASKSQVDYSSGYVTTTQNFVETCKQLQEVYKNSNVLICRDHCGPGFNGNTTLSDVYQTIDTDINNNFDLIHIDFCHLEDQRTILDESKRAIEYIQKKKPQMKIEIGTESNGRKGYNIEKVKKEMEYFLSFCNPTFFVCQTGSLTREISQVGTFEKNYIKEISEVARKFKLIVKEHNADYLDAASISERKGIIGAMNIAPQLGVVQTVLTLQKANLYGINTKKFLELSYQSKQWQKWLYNSNQDNLLLCSIIAGHYCFNSLEYKEMVNEISKQEDFDSSLEKEIHNLLDLYSKNFF